MGIIETILLGVGMFMILSLPLHVAVKILGGRTNIFKTMGVIVISSLAILVLSLYIDWAWLLFILYIFILKYSFDMKWLQAFLAWIISLALFVVLFLVLVFIFGTQQAVYLL